jgi:arabinofuranan 3-O-arabinosyltransferase
VNGVRAELGPGTTRVRVGLRDVSALRIRLTRVDQPDSDLRGSGGFREIRIPGVRLEQTLRTPVLTAQALAGRDLARTGLTYLFERQTGDRPRLRDRHTGSPLLELIPNRQDIEKQIDRTVFAPAARSYAIDAWLQPSVDARDPVLDRMAGLRGSTSFDSSSRFHNQPRYRASSAFDARPETAWISIWEPPSAPDPWISWTTARPLRLSRLRFIPSRLPIRRATVVRLSWAGGSSSPLRVAGDGTVELPRPVRSRAFRLTILKSRFPQDATARERSGRAVGIGSLEVPGLRPVRPRVEGPLDVACGSVRVEVGGRAVPLRPRGTVADLNQGRPLPARSCAGDVPMGKDIQRIRSLPGAFSVDLLRVRSPAPEGLPSTSGGGAVVDPGRLENSSLDGARVSLNGPSWLVFGQSYSRGWEATCDGRSLGEPRPVNGYGNGWRAPADCREVAFRYAPQATARAGYLISAVACLLFLALVVAGLVRGRRRPATPEPARLPDARPRRLPFIPAAAVALVVSAPLALLFAKRTGVVIFPVLTLILWRGIGPRPLIALAAGLLGLAVPIMYLLISPKDRGGYNFEYSVELIDAHWVGVGAIVLLGAACWRMLADARAGPAPSAQPKVRSITPMKTARAEYSRKS